MDFEMTRTPSGRFANPKAAGMPVAVRDFDPAVFQADQLRREVNGAAGSVLSGVFGTGSRNALIVGISVLGSDCGWVRRFTAAPLRNSGRTVICVGESKTGECVSEVDHIE